MQRVLQKLKYSVFLLVRVLSLSESNKLNGELASAKVSTMVIAAEDLIHVHEMQLHYWKAHAI